MSKTINDPNIAFRRANSSFKVWFSFLKGGNKTFYGAETNNTYSQMYHGHIKQLVLDKQLGFENCKKLAELNYGGKYTAAIIYQRLDGKEFEPVRKYVGAAVEDLKPVVFTKQNQYETYTVKLIGNSIELVPEPVNIDFKAEIEKALSNDTHK